MTFQTWTRLLNEPKFRCFLVKKNAVTPALKISGVFAIPTPYEKLRNEEAVQSTLGNEKNAIRKLKKTG
jgi:hypothetical protein